MKPSVLLVLAGSVFICSLGFLQVCVAQVAPDASQKVELVIKPHAPPSVKPTLLNADVIGMVHDRLPTCTVILEIERHPTKFDTSRAALRELKDAHVPQVVRDAMLNRAVPSLTVQNVSGVLVSAGSRKPLPDVRVELLNPESLTSLANTRSDAAGSYELPVRGDGIYLLRFSLAGESTKHGDLSVAVRNKASKKGLPVMQLKIAECSIVTSPIG